MENIDKLFLLELRIDMVDFQLENPEYKCKWELTGENGNLDVCQVRVLRDGELGIVDCLDFVVLYESEVYTSLREALETIKERENRKVKNKGYSVVDSEEYPSINKVLETIKGMEEVRVNIEKKIPKTIYQERVERMRELYDLILDGKNKYNECSINTDGTIVWFDDYCINHDGSEYLAFLNGRLTPERFTTASECWEAIKDIPF